jgi:hypothetical protein
MTESNCTAFNRYLAYCADFTTMPIEALDRMVAIDMQFRDPINELHGRDAFKRYVLETIERVERPRMTVMETGWVTPGHCFVKWRFAGEIRSLTETPWSVLGVSEIKLNKDGLIHSQVDYWDLASGLYEKFPVIGRLFKSLRRRLQLRA